MPSTLAALVLCSVVVVHDGDTFRCNGEKIRIANIDAPELPDSPRCKDTRRERAWCDYRAGYASRDALSTFLRSGQVKVQRLGVDRYGRTLASVTANGRDAGAYLVGINLAKWWR